MKDEQRRTKEFRGQKCYSESWGGGGSEPERVKGVK